MSATNVLHAIKREQKATDLLAQLLVSRSIEQVQERRIANLKAQVALMGLMGRKP